MSERIHYSEKEVKKIKIEDPYLDEALVGDGEKIKGPFPIHKFFYLMRTKTGNRLFLEKHPGPTNYFEYTKIHEAPDFMNEFFESNLLRVMIEKGILDKENFLVPSIKLSRDTDQAYYSEHFPDTLSCIGLDTEIFETIATANNITIDEAKSVRGHNFHLMYEKAKKLTFIFRKELRRKEIAAPLALLHLVSGDRDRVLTNYRFKKDKTAEGDSNIKIVVSEMSGGWGKWRDKPGMIEVNLLSKLTREEVMAFWPKIKNVIVENGLVSKIIDKSTLPQGLKDKKRDEVLSNIRNIEYLLDTEIAEKDNQE